MHRWLLALATVGMAVVLVGSQPGREHGGPLAWPDEYRLETHAGQSGTVSSGFVLPILETGGPAILESVDPEGLDGLSILAILASDPAGMAIGSRADWPAPSSAFGEAAGHAVAVGPGSRLQLVLVLHLDAAEGRMTGLRLSYRQGAIRYETTYRWSLVVRPAPT